MGLDGLQVLATLLRSNRTLRTISIGGELAQISTHNTSGKHHARQTCTAPFYPDHPTSLSGRNHTASPTARQILAEGLCFNHTLQTFILEGRVRVKIGL